MRPGVTHSDLNVEGSEMVEGGEILQIFSEKWPVKDEVERSLRIFKLNLVLSKLPAYCISKNCLNTYCLRHWRGHIK